MTRARPQPDSLELITADRSRLKVGQLIDVRDGRGPNTRSVPLLSVYALHSSIGENLDANDQ